MRVSYIAVDEASEPARAMFDTERDSRRVADRMQPELRALIANEHATEVESLADAEPVAAAFGFATGLVTRILGPSNDSIEPVPSNS